MDEAAELRAVSGGAGKRLRGAGERLRGAGERSCVVDEAAAGAVGGECGAIEGESPAGGGKHAKRVWWIDVLGEVFVGCVYVRVNKV